MPDLRVSNLAKVLVHYSLALKRHQQIVIHTSPLADELTLAVYEESIKVGAYPFIINEVPGTEETFFKYASNAQLDYISPLHKLINKTYDADLTIWTRFNTRNLSGVSPNRIARARKANAQLAKTFLQRAANGNFKWTLTVYPNNAMAQEAEMSLSDYTDFVFDAGMLSRPDPVAFWRNEAIRQQKLIKWLKGRNKAILKGSNVDISLSIKGRLFIECAGKENFPDGEIFTSPVENSVNGWIRFKYPAIYDGQEIEDIELWFEDGRVVKEKATKNQELLIALLNTDAGSRYLGEWGIGTNYGITRFTKTMLFDEKMGGTIHFAVGGGYPESGSKNKSGLHWDMLCEMNDSEIIIDGDWFYKNGKSVI